jgi:hypothetical protein
MKAQISPAPEGFSFYIEGNKLVIVELLHGGDFMDSNKSILNRKRNRELRELLNKLGESVDECVNFGTYILDFCSEKHEFAEWEAPIQTLFVQYLDLLDGVSILVKKGSPEASKIIMRSMLEFFASTEYILKEDTERRAKAYTVEHCHKRINAHKKLDSNTEQGKQFRSIFRKDEITEPMKLPDIPSDQRVANLQRMLESGEYKPIEDEWRKTKKPKWYKLFNGKNDFEQLMMNLNKPALYEVLYRPWSDLIHGGSLDRIKKTREGGAFKVVRVPEGIETIVSLSLNMSFEIYRTYLSKYNPERLLDFNEWYKANMRKVYLEVSQRTLVDINWDGY